MSDVYILKYSSSQTNLFLDR